MTNLRLDSDNMRAGSKLRATVTLTNTGSRQGSETVMLFVGDKEASVARPVRELKAFSKVNLEPGESRDVTLTIGTDALSFYDETTKSWTVEAGDFIIECQAGDSRLSETITYE